MRKITALLLLLSFAVIPGIAQDAHKNVVYQAYPDQRGQVFMTVDKDGIARVWNISDGKLAAEFSQTSSEWAPKLVRYKIAHSDYTQRGFENKTVYEGGLLLAEYRVDGVLKSKEKTFGTPLWNPETKKLLVEYNDFKGGEAEWKTSMYSAAIPPGSEPSTKLEYAYHGTHPFVAQFVTSPRALWLLSYRSKLLMNYESKKVYKMPAEVPVEIMNSRGRFAFNPDETQFAVSTQDGMVVIDIETMKPIREIKLPKTIKRSVGQLIYPLSDMQSFVYTGAQYQGKDEDKSRKAWLVKESGAIALSGDQ